jgi:hypothetical protein
MKEILEQHSYLYCHVKNGLKWYERFLKNIITHCAWFQNLLFYSLEKSHWTYWLQILSKLCLQRVALSGNYEIVAICTDKNTFFNDLDYKANIGQHFLKSEKSARRRHCHKIIKTNLKTLVSPLLMHPQGSQGCQKMRQDPLNMPVEVWCGKIAPK